MAWDRHTGVAYTLKVRSATCSEMRRVSICSPLWTDTASFARSGARLTGRAESIPLGALKGAAAISSRAKSLPSSAIQINANTPNTMPLSVVILAAGQGTRMKSDLPKVLHPLAGQPLLQHVVDSARALEAERIVVVYGHGGDRVREALADQPIEWVLQAQQLGTGHAVQQALPLLPADHAVLVLYGDVPLVRQETLTNLLEALGERNAGAAVAVLTTELEDATGYGRIVRDSHRAFTAIVEHKDATPEQREIGEINSGIMATAPGVMAELLPKVSNDNAQKEYYLTDLVALARESGSEVAGVITADSDEVRGVNNRLQLAELERLLQQRQAEALMREGVTLRDPARFDLRGRLNHGRDVTIDINVIIEGEVTLGDRVQIGPNCVLRNVTLADDVTLLENCVLDQAVVGTGARVGPYSRLRPGTELAARTHVGNFVECKKARIGEGSKVNHLSYVGDAEVGRDVNIGAGTITCNYDGANKHLTTIEDRVFVGSNSALVAPLTLEAGSTIGAGSVITKDAPAEELTLARARQSTISGWKRPVKKG